MTKESLLREIYAMYKNAKADYPEIASMSYDKFVEFEEDSYKIEVEEGGDLTEIEYFAWIRDHFGEWCSPQ